MVKGELNKKLPKRRIKGTIFIILGIIILIIYFGAEIKDIQLPPGGLLIILLSLYLIWEGSRIKNDKKSILFNLPSYPSNH